MNKKNKSKANEPSSNSFLTFWSTLPGILTGIAALMTAIAGLYLAFSHGETGNNKDSNVAPSPISSISPKPSVSPDKCLEQEFADVLDTIDVNTTQTLRSTDKVVKVKLRDKVPVGALSLSFNNDASPPYFIVERVCNLDDLFDKTEGRNVDPDYKNVPDNDYLHFKSGGQKYSLRLMSKGSALTVLFEKLR